MNNIWPAEQSPLTRCPAELLLGDRHCTPRIFLRKRDLRWMKLCRTLPFMHMSRARIQPQLLANRVGKPNLLLPLQLVEDVGCLADVNVDRSSEKSEADGVAGRASGSGMADNGADGGACVSMLGTLMAAMPPSIYDRKKSD